MSAQVIEQGVVRNRFLTAPFDTVTGDVLNLFRIAEPRCEFRYVVTPNVDHVVRVARDPELRRIYEGAWFSICDSKPIAALARTIGLKLTHFPGSNLTDSLFNSRLTAGCKIALVAPSDTIGKAVAEAYPTLEVAWLAPPQGTSGDAKAMQTCVDFVATADADFIFIAIGSPTSEKIAYAAAQDPRSRGVALCVGAALEFLIGGRRRAPLWMQAAGFEWAFRLASEPRRLWRRYVFGVVPLIRLFATEVRARRSIVPNIVELNR